MARSPLFLIVRPKFLTFKNSWFGKSADPLARVVRFSLLLTIAIFVPYTVYLAIQQSVIELEGTEGALISILEVINVTFLSIVFFSSSVHSLNNLFLSKDNELLLASPISNLTFFAGKLLETIFASSWILILFYVPAVWAVGSAYQAPWSFHLIGLFYVFPLTVAPCSISMIATILFVRLYPAHRVRELIIIASIIVIIGLHFGLHGHQLLLQTIGKDIPELSEQAILKGIGHHFAEQSLTLLSTPFYLASEHQTFKALQALGAAFAGASICLIASYRCFSDLYTNVFTLDYLSRAPRTISSEPQTRLRFRILPRVASAFVFKDRKLFMRDLGQPVQLILFICMAIFAVLGFSAAGDATISMKQKYEWWIDFLVCLNLGFHLLLTILFAGRFIFPAVATEGEAAWLIKAAPVPTLSFFRSKLFVTATPSTIILLSFLLISCSMSKVPVENWLFVFVVGLANTLCVAAVSMGLGAYFAQMRYEHLGQITTGIGSVFSMFITLLIVPFNNFIVVGFSYVLHVAKIVSDQTITVICVILLCMIHYFWVRYFLRKGEERWLSQ